MQKKNDLFTLEFAPLQNNGRLSPLAKNTYQLIRWPRLVTLQVLITNRYSLLISYM